MKKLIFYFIALAAAGIYSGSVLELAKAQNYIPMFIMVYLSISIITIYLADKLAKKTK